MDQELHEPSALEMAHARLMVLKVKRDLEQNLERVLEERIEDPRVSESTLVNIGNAVLDAFPTEGLMKSKPRIADVRTVRVADTLLNRRNRAYLITELLHEGEWVSCDTVPIHRAYFDIQVVKFGPHQPRRHMRKALLRLIGSVRTEMTVQLQPLIPIKHIELKMQIVPRGTEWVTEN